MQTQKQLLINDILQKANSQELQNFPATKNRLISIAEKLKRGEMLFQNDYETLNLNIPKTTKQ